MRLNAGLEMGAASAVATYDSAERLVLIGRQLVARRHTAAAARRARALAVLRPFTFLELAPSVPPSPNADGAGHFLNFTTCFYYTTPNLELKKVTCATRHNLWTRQEKKQPCGVDWLFDWPEKPPKSQKMAPKDGLHSDDSDEGSLTQSRGPRVELVPPRLRLQRVLFCTEF